MKYRYKSQETLEKNISIAKKEAVAKVDNDHDDNRNRALIIYHNIVPLLIPPSHRPNLTLHLESDSGPSTETNPSSMLHPPTIAFDLDWDCPLTVKARGMRQILHLYVTHVHDRSLRF